MSLFSNCGCGRSNDCGNDTILWFIILFLLIFCNDSFSICGSNGCGSNNCCD